MSIVLDESKPHGLTAKTFGFNENNIHLFGNDHTTNVNAEINEMDFMILVFYYMTNSDLRRDDIRLKMVRMFKNFTEVSGFNPQNVNSKRLEIDLSAIKEINDILSPSISKKFNDIRNAAKKEGSANIPKVLIDIKKLLSESHNSKLKQQINKILKEAGI